MGSLPKDGEIILLNRVLYSLCAVLKVVTSSAVEAELCALFLNIKAGKIFRLTLNKLGYQQPPTQINCNNITNTGIYNNNVKKHQ